jgi:PST family polysaccharide transporter
VSLSGFAAKQGDNDALRHGFLRVYELLVATTLPVHALGVVLSPLLFTVFMPERYQPALTCFQLLLAFAAVRSLAAHVAPFYNAINKAHINLYYFLISTPLCIAIMYAACRHRFESGGVQAGLNALGWATLLSQGLATLGVLTVAKYVVGWSDAGLLRRAMPYATATALAAGVSYGVAFAAMSISSGLPARAYGFVVLVVATGAGMGVYATTLYVAARPKLAVLVRDAVPGKLRDRVVYRWLPQLRNA